MSAGDCIASLRFKLETALARIEEYRLELRILRDEYERYKDRSFQHLMELLELRREVEHLRRERARLERDLAEARDEGITRRSA